MTRRITGLVNEVPKPIHAAVVINASYRPRLENEQMLSTHIRDGRIHEIAWTSGP